MRDEMDALVGRTARVSDADVEALALHAAETDLMEEIMSTPKLEPALAAEPPRRPRIRRWGGGRRLVAIAGAAAAAAAALVAVQVSSDDGEAWAAQTVAIAEDVPRILVDDSAWQIDDVYVTSKLGEVYFKDGEREVSVYADTSEDYDMVVEEIRSQAPEETAVTVAGQDALMFGYGDNDGTELDDGTEFAEPLVVWQQDGHVVSVSAMGFTSQSEVEAMLGTMVQADVSTWLSALPDDVVQPTERAAVVDDMLSDVPTPDGFDRDAVSERTGISSRYYFGADVAGAVSCAWLGQWVEATSAGDDAAADEAVAAMGTSRDWAVLKELGKAEQYAEEVWMYADALADGGRIPDDAPVGEGDFMGYEGALGCND